MSTPTGPSPAQRFRELMPWEMAVHREPLADKHPGLMIGLAVAASMAAEMGAQMPTGRAAPVIRKENPKTKRLHKAQRAARKAERRGRK